MLAIGREKILLILTLHVTDMRPTKCQDALPKIFTLHSKETVKMPGYPMNECLMSVIANLPFVCMTASHDCILRFEIHDTRHTIYHHYYSLLPCCVLFNVLCSVILMMKVAIFALSPILWGNYVVAVTNRRGRQLVVSGIGA